MKNNVSIAETAEKINQGANNVTRYNVTVRNAPGEFLMIPKQELEVDAAYQRNRINQRRVDALTRTLVCWVNRPSASNVSVEAPMRIMAW